MTELRLATRGSELALWQARRVASLVVAAHPGVSVVLVPVDTAGDRRADVPIAELAGQGVFVKEVQAAVLDGRADLAVHSAKDLPSDTPPGLVLACVPERADPRDALVGSTLADLPAGALVATGSARRRAQLAWLRPDLTFTGLRGNVATRLAKASPERVVVVAAAALARLGLLHRADDIVAPSILLPQVAQGALAVECRADDRAAQAALAAIDDAVAHRAVAAERGFLRRLGGGCDLPVGALATVSAGEIAIEGMLASADGHVLLRARRVGAVLLRARRVGAAGDGSPPGSGGAAGDGSRPGSGGAAGDGSRPGSVGAAGDGSPPGSAVATAAALEAAADVGAALAEELLAAGGAELLGDRYVAAP